LTIPRDDKKIWKHYTDIRKNSGIKNKLKNGETNNFTIKFGLQKAENMGPVAAKPFKNHRTHAQAIIQ
jgi:uncharacterized protein YcaQ